ncbi:hypothetical protein EW026_g2070 [Hermanssonia centrifuga]|uniref:Uncharacterized protein n=2 Tax=Hermanssonia centrifuga TaxID=98765 RepID=A0A4S4KPG3_9APHY|nr:hypothetical protein PHLCEN_2v1180 [Hermanssonia centrifuga]THH00482.1 hypothetical protein EW026_g2070 [Hermanssonia centrifuga]
MFSKVFCTLALVMGLTLQVQAHAIISPALGVTGTPVRNDVQRPSTASPCGSVNIAKTLDTTTPIVAAADGSFTTNITNFNAGKDGSRQVTATVDATGTGSKFVAATVTENGDLAPTDVGSQPLAVQLPAGATCTGGTSGNLCLVSFTTAGGFGNCVVVQQAGAAGAAAAANSTAGAAAVANSTTAAAASTSSAAACAVQQGDAAGAVAAGNATAAAKPKHAKGGKAKQQNARRAWGTRLARAARAAIDELELH